MNKKNKLLTQAEKKRAQARVRQQKRRDLRQERKEKKQLTEKDLIDIEKEKSRKRKS